MSRAVSSWPGLGSGRLVASAYRPSRRDAAAIASWLGDQVSDGLPPRAGPVWTVIRSWMPGPMILATLASTCFFGGSTTECGYSSGPWHSKMLVGPHRRGAETGMGDAHRPDRKVVGAQAPTRRSLARARHYCIQPPSGPSWYHRARGLVRAGADHRHGCVAPPPARLR